MVYGFEEETRRSAWLRRYLKSESSMLSVDAIISNKLHFILFHKQLQNTEFGSAACLQHVIFSLNEMALSCSFQAMLLNIQNAI